MERYVCIHGHFYQPPRENPWLEVIEFQDTAYPYHDWNRRITAESYAPNALSRILDEKGRIVEIVNNYAKMSFNFGPTLLHWMEKNSPDVYKAVLEADRKSRETFSGHGSAIAQAFNHMIFPLANRRDKITQVLWGIRDFEHRFGRFPEGMWISETAVDIETLDIMAEQGIRFSILAPHQAKQVRSENQDWQSVEDGKIDPTRPYIQQLPSGRSIVLFFYDGPTSRAVAFEKLLSSGESFAQRLIGNFSDKRTWPQIVHIATDGESYGHHHRFGDMALAYALHHIESNNLARLTNYGEYLEKHPPEIEVEIFENTSWSCPHGVERWCSDCGCHTGANPGWRQQWRNPLREALDWLRDSLAPVYEENAAQFLKDPWEARNEYIKIFLNRSEKMIDEFFSQHALKTLSRGEKASAFKLLELQRHAMLMYTSCGWFFDDLSGIETIQVIQYAGRVIQLAGEIFGQDLESEFLVRLEKARSNDPGYGDGRRIYEKFVKPAMVDLKKACAYYAVSSLFDNDSEHKTICTYVAEREDYRSFEAGSSKLVVGRVILKSEVTLDLAGLDFGILHLGDHNLNCGIREHQGDDNYKRMVEEVSSAFELADIPETLRILDKHFGTCSYSLKSLYRDEQRRILNLILESTIKGVEAVYRRLYEHNAPLMLFLKDSDSPPPKILYMAAEVAINADLRLALMEDDLDHQRIKSILETARVRGISLETDTLEYTFRKTLERLSEKFAAGPKDLATLKNLVAALGLVDDLPFQVILWKLQNACYMILQSAYPGFHDMADQGDENAREWISQFTALSKALSVRVYETSM